MKRIGLLPRILIAIVVGIAIGYVAPMWFASTMATFNAIFSQFLGFMIPMIIVGFVAPAIADIGGRAGKLLLVTAAIAYFATFMAGLLSYFTGSLTFPSLIGGEEGIALAEDSTKVLPYFNIERPPLMTVMTARVLAFML
uniref:cation:dicarboxylate symporter family transporter n=1 Tax=uncultured Duncaniella sp. TaxID=2768039 RepID=UPI002616AB87